MARYFDLKAQFGGNDQWSNIIAGVDLTRKTCGKEVYGLTVALLTTSEAYRTIQGGGARINGTQITDKKYAVTEADFENGELVLQKGKKKYMKITMK